VELYRRMFLGERPSPTIGSCTFIDRWTTDLMAQMAAAPSALFALMGPPAASDRPLPKHFLPPTTTYRWPAGDFCQEPDW